MRTYRSALVPIGRLKPSVYNPREADEERLEILELSLRKLGFVLPIVATSGGEILSGHQRHLVAQRLGFEEVPVLVLKNMPAHRRKGLNLLFNRATNDFAQELSTKQAGQEIKSRRGELKAMAAKMKDAPPFACLTPEIVKADPLFRKNADLANSYALQVAKPLLQAGCVMPVVIDSQDRVVNGVGRLEVLAREGGWAPVVRITGRQRKFAALVLNLLTMDYTLEKQMENELRFNSFRRASLRRHFLGFGYACGIYDHPAGKKSTLAKPKERQAWAAKVGQHVVDFGSGHGDEARIVRAAGFQVTEFEPYRIQLAAKREEIDKPAVLAMARELLDKVRAGEKFGAVILASILNSIPYEADREHVVQIAAALAPQCFGSTLHVSQPMWRLVEHGRVASLETTMTKLDYEEGVSIGAFKDKPKMQRHFTNQQVYDLLKTAWKTVKVWYCDRAVLFRAVEPAWDPQRLAAALRFEFDLPYPDGTRMGLAAEALDAFSEKLGIVLTKAGR